MPLIFIFTALQRLLFLKLIAAPSNTTVANPSNAHNRLPKTFLVLYRFCSDMPLFPKGYIFIV